MDGWQGDEDEAQKVGGGWTYIADGGLGSGEDGGNGSDESHCEGTGEEGRAVRARLTLRGGV